MTACVALAGCAAAPLPQPVAQPIAQSAAAQPAPDPSAQRAADTCRAHLRQQFDFSRVDRYRMPDVQRLTIMQPSIAFQRLPRFGAHRVLVFYVTARISRDGIQTATPVQRAYCVLTDRLGVLGIEVEQPDEILPVPW